MSYVIVRRLLIHCKNAEMLLNSCAERLLKQNHQQIIPKAATYTKEALTRTGTLTAQGVKLLMAIQFVKKVSKFNKLQRM